MLEELLKESEVLQELAREYAAELAAKEVTKERDEALAKGRAEGRAEGHAEGERDMARVAIEGRFGPLSEDVLNALRSTDLEILTDIVAQLATISLEQVRARLGLS